MNLLESFLSPISIAFAVLIVGYFLGRIKVFGISLDLAAVLVVAVAVGYVLTSNEAVRNVLNIPKIKEDMQLFSSLGTSLFVAVIGITTGYSLNLRKAKEIKAILIGMLMVASAFTVMQIVAFLDENVSYSSLLGSLCGALTTTPGLSATNELSNIISEEATIGYGSSYLFGVIATVLFIQIIAREYETIGENENQNANVTQAALGGLIQIGIAVLLGRLIGGIRLGYFSLGNSGGILFAGIILGVIVQMWLPKKIASTKTMETFRNLGLIIFFVGNGIPAGMSFHNGLDVKVILYGALMTITSLITGTILSRLIDRNGCTASVIAGGMTSTPAVGVLLRKRCRIQLSSYSMAYVGALLTIIILIRLL